MLKVNNLIGFGTRRASSDPTTDPHFANVVLLCGFDGSDGATSATDDSPSVHSLTFNGNAQIDTAQFVFGGASLLLGASGDYIETADSADWLLRNGGTQPFTVEFRYRPSTLAATKNMVGQWRTSDNQRSWLLSAGSGSGNLVFQRSSAGTSGSVATLVSTGTEYLVANTWSAIAFDYDGTTLRVYHNGTMVGSSTDATAYFNSAAPLTIGAQAGGVNPALGHYDEIRITKGVARYASDGGYSIAGSAFPRT